MNNLCIQIFFSLLQKKKNSYKDFALSEMIRCFPWPKMHVGNPFEYLLPEVGSGDIQTQEDDCLTISLIY